MKNYLTQIIEHLSSRILARACYRALERLDEADSMYPRAPRQIDLPTLPQVEHYTN